MKFDVKDVDKCTKLISIEVVEEKIKQAYSNFYIDLAKTAKVPGFRAGRVPKNVLELHYKDEAKEEVLKRLVSDSFYEVVHSEKIDIFSYPDIEDVKFDDKQLLFKARVEIRPSFELKKYKGISVKEEKVKVENKEIDETVERIRDSYSKFIPIEDRPVEMGDFAVCDIESKFADNEPESKKNELCEIKSNEMMPGFAESVVGMKVGEEKEIEIKLPKNFPNEKMQGKVAIFKVLINEIKKKQLPELDEELLKSLGEYNSVDEFKEAISKDIEAKKQQDADSKLERNLIDKIEKDLKFDVPNSLIKKRLSGLVQEATASLIRQGFPQEMAVAKKDELEKQYKDESVRQVKVAFILDKIADAEKIDTTADDLKTEFNKLAIQYNQPINIIEEHYIKNKMVDSLKAEIRNQKVIDFIKDNAEIK